MNTVKETPFAVEDAKGINKEISHVHFTKSLFDSPIQNDVAVATKNFLVTAGSNGTMSRKLCTKLIRILNLGEV